MALRVAVANGNWSSTSTWNAGIIPAAGDIVASNNFTVTIDQNINVDSITNAATLPVKATPNMTGYTTPSGIVTISTINTGRPGWQAFDGNSGTIAQTNTGGPGWIAYEFTTPIIINAYSWVSSANEQPSNWNFEGWDGSNWVVLHTVTGGSTGYTSPLIGNNTAYIAYRVNVTLVLLAANRPIWYEINLFEKGSDLAAVAGGGFILNDGLTLTCTGSGVVTGTTTCLTYSGSGVCTINANIFPANANTGAGVSGLIYSGSGTLNINGNLNDIGLSIERGPTVLFSGTGTLNIIGNINGLQVRQALRITNTSVCNIVGNLNPGNAAIAVQVTGNAIVNITGNIFPQVGGSAGSSLLLISAAAAVVTVTGNVYPDTTFFQLTHGISVTGSSQLYIIGTINGGSGSYNTVISSTNCFISVIGSIKSQRGIPAFYSIGPGAINILTGPFISGDSGVQPFYVVRMHYRRTLGSYYEFRDNSTLGALPPSPSAPATRLVSPDTVADSPIPRNVRQGTIYAAGSQTGTMIVPSRDNVAKGVLVDNTIGTAILDADSIWAVPLTSINTLNSIGKRVKNAATVETTGAQIQQTLNDNE
jgi:hypothetical protein